MPLASAADLPPPSERHIDVALLDMNHGAVNVGYDAVVDCVERTARVLEPTLRESDRCVRLLSFDVRRGLLVPQHSPRYSLYIGTGGPGHLDPRRNVRNDDEVELIEEDGSWEAPLFDLFDAVLDDERAALLGVCHTFGLLCRWAGVAQPVLRSAEQGASVGLRETTLSDAGREHPWFSHLAKQLPDGRRFPVLDSRHYDLIPSEASFPPGMSALGFETLPDGMQGPALTMFEAARSTSLAMPRMFGVNFHAEIGDAASLRGLLLRKLERGEVSKQWYEGRAALLPELARDPQREELRLAGHAFCFVMLLHAYLASAVARITVA